MQRQKRVVGALFGSSSPRLQLPRIFRLYTSGARPWTGWSTHGARSPK